MKILIISGFLGAGKTSFIKAMAKATGKEFVIVENEFGELGVDGKILREEFKSSEVQSDMKIWEISEGCICCSLNLDFSLSVLTISNALNPDYLIIEPSGVALTSNIIKKLNKICYEKIELLAPVAVVDIENFLVSKIEFSEYFNDQVQSAGIIVISKSEDVEHNEFEKVKASLNISNEVIFPMKHYSYWDTEEWQKVLNRKIVYSKDSETMSFKDITIPKEQELESMSMKDPDIANPDELYHVLNQLCTGKYGRVIRAKGYLNKNNPFRFELVEGKFMISGIDTISSSRAVVIGRDLEDEKIKKLFNQI